MIFIILFIILFSVVDVFLEVCLYFKPIKCVLFARVCMHAKNYKLAYLFFIVLVKINHEIKHYKLS